MATEPELIVLPNAQLLAEDVAARTLAILAQAQLTRPRAALALTAGSIMEKAWAAMAASAAAASVDWSRVDVFWADERFVPAGSEDRNDGPADELLFTHAPFNAATRYPMPPSDAGYADLDAAAAGYLKQLTDARRSDDTDEIPNFDVLLLGVGPDGHCASLFPNHPGVHDESAPVIAVRNSPKPPPERLSLSFDGLDLCNEIWFVASGDGKADAVKMALSPDADRTQVPSSGPRGRNRTLWLVDADAAANLP
jgi:6-phosphogluconolactonase